MGKHARQSSIYAHTTSLPSRVLTTPTSLMLRPSTVLPLLLPVFLLFPVTALAAFRYSCCSHFLPSLLPPSLSPAPTSLPPPLQSPSCAPPFSSSPFPILSHSTFVPSFLSSRPPPPFIPHNNPAPTQATPPLPSLFSTSTWTIAPTGARGWKRALVPCGTCDGFRQ